MRVGLLKKDERGGRGRDAIFPLSPNLCSRRQERPINLESRGFGFARQVVAPRNKADCQIAWDREKYSLFGGGEM